MASGVIQALQDERKNRAEQIETLQKEWDGKRFDADAKHRYNKLNEEIEEFDARIELAKRDERLAEIKTRAKEGEQIEAPQSRRPGAVAEDLDFDVRTVVVDPMDPAATGREFKDRALRVVETIESDGRFKKEEAQDRLDGLLRNTDSVDGAIARHLLVTGSPAYKRAFRNILAGSYLTPEESNALAQARAMSLTGTSGGFAVPYELDPSIIPTSNLAINPYRAISRVVNITVDEWRGVSSAGITAAYAAEATAATDASPTLAQPTISTEKARAFVPFSIEVGQDWNSIQTELGQLLSDSKDELEATKFTLGSGTNEPQGIITGATTVYTAAGTNTLSSADLFGWVESLGARFRPRSTFVSTMKTFNNIRRFDTQGGAMIWQENLSDQAGTVQIPTPGSLNATLLGRPAYESSAMSSTYTTGQLIGVLGDFNYYVIVDRLGLTVEVIPHLFDVTNNMPTGQRGLYAYWRNGAGVISANAFRTLKLA